MISASQLKTFANCAIVYMIIFAFLGIYLIVAKTAHPTSESSGKITTTTHVLTVSGIQHRKS